MNHSWTRHFLSLATVWTWMMWFSKVRTSGKKRKYRFCWLKVSKINPLTKILRTSHSARSNKSWIKGPNLHSYTSSNIRKVKVRLDSIRYLPCCLKRGLNQAAKPTDTFSNYPMMGLAIWLTIIQILGGTKSFSKRRHLQPWNISYCNRHKPSSSTKADQCLPCWRQSTDTLIHTYTPNLFIYQVVFSNTAWT